MQLTFRFTVLIHATNIFIVSSERPINLHYCRVINVHIDCKQ